MPLSQTLTWAHSTISYNPHFNGWGKKTHTFASSNDLSALF
jgi:hypothetical protein